MNGLRRVRVTDNKGRFDFEGDFHGWYAESMEYETGPSNFTVALVEKSDGHVEMVSPGKIQFLTDLEARP